MYKNIPKNPIKFGLYISGFHKKHVFSALACVITASLMGSRINLLVLKNLTDSLTGNVVDFNGIWTWAIAYALIFVTTENIWRASGFFGMRWFMNFRFSAYEALYEYLTLHSKDYFNSRFAGSLANKIAHAVDGTEALFEKMLWNFIPLFISLLWYVVYSWIINSILGVIVTIWTILFLGLNYWFSKKLRPKSMKFADALSTLKGRIVDSLSNISLVHEYSHVAGERSYIKNFVKEQHDTGLDHWQLSEFMLLANGILLFIFMLIFLSSSIILFQNSIVSAGIIIVVISIIKDLSDRMLFLGQEIRDAGKFFGEAQEGLEEILKEHIIIDSDDAKPLVFESGNILIKSINFDYENTNVFNDFSLEIPQGQKIGLVGRSGAGKTTLVSLLLRHYDIKKGEITIDNQNISDITLDSLRKVISFVPQDTSLFHRTIRENISYSNPESSLNEVKKAASLAQADKFIESLPHKYETLVGERGVKLSGGQRQRIAIARAFLKNAPILILDEATSSLDSESEQAIQLSLEQLMEGRTVIAIAHRLSTLKEMDRIIVIQNGKVAEDGSPDDLLKKTKGVFKSMWERQVHGFITDD